MYNVNWEIFLAEEHEALNKLIEMGERDSLALGVIDMTPAKEAEIQKIADHMRPVDRSFESEVAKKYVNERLAKGEEPSPQSPEEEAILQRALDAEMKAAQDLQKAKSAERQESLDQVTKPPFCTSCDSRGGVHKKECTKLIK